MISWLGVMFMHTKQLDMKLSIDTFVLGQHTESLTRAFIPTLPWWTECKQPSTFPPRDFRTTVFPSINTKPLSILSLWHTSPKSWFLVQWKNIWRKNPYSVGFIHHITLVVSAWCKNIIGWYNSLIVPIICQDCWLCPGIYFVPEVDVLVGGVCRK